MWNRRLAVLHASGDDGRAMSQKPEGVQSVARAMELIEILTGLGGEARITCLAAEAGLPQPTVHRLLSTLAARGYVFQLASRQYTLGSRLIGIGEQASRQLGGTTHALLTSAAHDLGESVNFALLQQDMAVYVDNVPSPFHSMRTFTEIGRRVHCSNTGVGKAILSLLSHSEVVSVIERTGMPTPTPASFTCVDELLEDLDVIRPRGYALDEGENETGVRCIAVPLFIEGTPAAVSSSGPTGRMTEDVIGRAYESLVDLAARIEHAAKR